MYSSLTVRPSVFGWANFRWWASQGDRLQIRQGCPATKARCALLRRRTGFVMGGDYLTVRRTWRANDAG